MLQKVNQALRRGGDWIESWMPEWFTDNWCLFLLLFCGFWLLVAPL